MAVYYFRNTGNSDYGLSTNWSLSDGGPADGAVPTASDDAIFTLNSGNVSVAATNKVCAKLITNGYTGTINISTVLTTAGDVTLYSATTINGTGTLSFSGTIIATRNGATINVSNTRIISGTITLADTWNVVNFVFQGNGAKLNSNTLNISGNLSLIQNAGIGTTNIVINGTGNQTWSGYFSLRNNLTINKSSGNFIVSSNVWFQHATLTHLSGTVVTTSSSILSQATTSWNCSGITWNNFNLQGGTQTLTSNINVGGGFSSSNAVVYNGADLILSGNMVINQRMDGTSSIRYKGTGTWSQQGPIHLPLYIETPGTLTLAGTVCAEKINYISGTVITAGSTIQTTGNIGSMVYSCSAITFNNVTTVFGTLTLNQPLNISGTYTVGASNTVIFAGAYGFSAGTFFCTTPGRIINFTSGITYNCNNLTLRGTDASRIQFKSSTSNAYTYFNLVTGGTCDVKYVNATDIDSSGGRLITDVKGTLTRTINWYKTNPDYFSFF